MSAYLLSLLVGIVVFGVVRAFITTKFPSRGVVRKESELAPGIIRPSYLLAQMVAADLLQLLPEHEWQPAKDSFTQQYMVYKIAWSKRGQNHHIEYYEPYRRFEISSHSFNGVTWVDEDKTILMEAIRKSKAILANKKKAEEEEKAQQRAVDWVAALTGVEGNHDNQ